MMTLALVAVGIACGIAGAVWGLGWLAVYLERDAAAQEKRWREGVAAAWAEYARRK